MVRGVERARERIAGDELDHLAEPCDGGAPRLAGRAELAIGVVAEAAHRAVAQQRAGVARAERCLRDRRQIGHEHGAPLRLQARRVPELASIVVAPAAQRARAREHAGVLGVRAEDEARRWVCHARGARRRGRRSDRGGARCSAARRVAAGARRDGEGEAGEGRGGGGGSRHAAMVAPGVDRRPAAS